MYKNKTPSLEPRTRNGAVQGGRVYRPESQNPFQISENLEIYPCQTLNPVRVSSSPRRLVLVADGLKFLDGFVVLQLYTLLLCINMWEW